MPSLAEYARQNGMGEPPAQSPAMPTYEEQHENWKRVELLKQSIMEQLEEGKEPESILYTALQALSLATNDPVFFDRGCPFLNGDKVEQSLFLDLDEMQQKRDNRRRAYFEKRRKEIVRQMKQLENDRTLLARELEQIPKED